MKDFTVSHRCFTPVKPHAHLLNRQRLFFSLKYFIKLLHTSNRRNLAYCFRSNLLSHRVQDGLDRLGMEDRHYCRSLNSQSSANTLFSGLWLASLQRTYEAPYPSLIRIQTAAVSMTSSEFTCSGHN